MKPTPTQAVVRGHLVVSVPSLLVLAVVAVAVHRMAGWHWPPAILTGSLVAWPVWAFTVPRWRDWVEDSGLTGDDVQRLAAGTGLVLPRGFPIEWMEFRRRNGTVGWTVEPEAVAPIPSAVAPHTADDDVRAFVGPNAEYYLARFSRATPGGGVQWLGFNWAALLTGWIWLLYRRMYGTFWALVGVMLAFGVATGVVAAIGGQQEPPRWLANAFTVATMVFLGTCGNWLYYRHVTRKLRRVSKFSTHRQEDLARAGGVSWMGPVALLLLSVVLILIAGMAGMAAGA